MQYYNIFRILKNTKNIYLAPKLDRLTNFNIAYHIFYSQSPNLSSFTSA